MKSRVLFYSGHSSIVGGDAKYAADIINEYHQHEDFEFFFYTDLNREFKRKFKIWNINNIKVNYLKTLPNINEEFNKKLNKNKFIIKYKIDKILKKLFLLDFYHDIKNIFIFIKLFLKIKPDIFHFNNGGYPGKRSGLLGICVAKFFSIKTIMTVQNMPNIGRNYYYSFFLLNLIVPKFIDKTICVSKSIKKSLIKNEKFIFHKTTTIYHGIKKTRKINFVKKKIIFTLVANIDDMRKGHENVIEATKLLINENIKNFKVIFVGDGIYMNYFKNKINKSCLKSNIIFKGFVSDVEKINQYSDIAMVPSINFEGMPNTLKEAMRAGKPIIASKIPGITEVIYNGKNGYLIDPNSPDKIKNAMKKLIINKKLRKKMGECAIRDFEKNFNINKMLQKHTKIYEFFKKN